MTEEVQDYEMVVAGIETTEMTDQQAIALGEAIAENHLEAAAELLACVRDAGAKVPEGAYTGVATMPMPSGAGAFVAQFVRDRATAAVFVPAAVLADIGQSLINMARAMPLLAQLSGIEDIEAEITKY